MDGVVLSRYRALAFAPISFHNVLGVFLQLVVPSEWQLCHPALSRIPPVCYPLSFLGCVLFHGADGWRTGVLELITFLKSQAVVVIGHQVAFRLLTIIL